jgi:hypothetical protein
MTVDLYLAKAPAAKGPTLPKGKKLEGDPEAPVVIPTPEAVMIVIVGQAPAK